jgi:hypothetical protein
LFALRCDEIPKKTCADHPAVGAAETSRRREIQIAAGVDPVALT